MISPALHLDPASPGTERFIYCASRGPHGTHGRLPKPLTLRRVRLLVDAGKRRRPKVVPMVVSEKTDRAALTRANRMGRRFFGKKFLGAVCGTSLRLAPATIADLRAGVIQAELRPL